MKRWVLLFTAFVILLGLCSCSQTETFKEPVNLYYIRSQLSFGETNSVISYEIHEGSGLSGEDILRSYFLGPETESFQNPFPEDVALVSVSHDEETVYIKVTDQMASLSGIQLTLACVCITQTCLELFDAEYVSISTETQPLNGSSEIVMSDSSVAFSDNGWEYTESAPPN